MKRWPERILAAAGFVLWLALLPMVVAGTWPVWTSAALTASMLALMSGAQYALGLKRAGFVTALSSATWLVLLIGALLA